MAQPRRRRMWPGSTLAAGTSDQLHCCHSEECLVAASFWHMQMPPARAQKAHGPGKKNKNKSKNENETAVSVC